MKFRYLLLHIFFVTCTTNPRWYCTVNSVTSTTLFFFNTLCILWFIDSEEPARLKPLYFMSLDRRRSWKFCSSSPWYFIATMMNLENFWFSFSKYFGLWFPYQRQFVSSSPLKVPWPSTHRIISQPSGLSGNHPKNF